MNTTPRQFAELLAGSSLSDTQKEMILAALPSLSPAEREKIVLHLRKDVREVQKIFDQAERKRQKIQMDYEAGWSELLSAEGDDSSGEGTA